MSKLKVKLIALTVVGLLTFGVKFQQKANAYQFTGISSDTDANRHRQLLWVRNSEASTALGNGDVVVWYDGSVADGLEVKLTTSARSSLVAGVAVQTIAAGSWGFIQTHGYHSAINIAVANSAGDCLTTSTTSGHAGVLAIAESTTTVTADHSVFAIAFETTTTSTTVKGLITR